MSPIPETLKPEIVAPLLCGIAFPSFLYMLASYLMSLSQAGLTMYGALNKLDKYCDKGDWVVIMGAGGGLGHLYLSLFSALSPNPVYTAY